MKANPRSCVKNRDTFRLRVSILKFSPDATESAIRLEWAELDVWPPRIKKCSFDEFQDLAVAAAA